MAPSETSLLVGRWDITTQHDPTAPVKEHLAESTAESVFDPDFRSLVDEKDFHDGGKYRSIVKLQMQYEHDQNAWFMGTGWLIRPDLMVTAGHNVYNWANDLGKAQVIKCHIGYYGKESVGKPGVQSRFAKRIVTTAGWLKSSENREHDLAFIQVDQPFSGNLRLFTYGRTPGSGNEMLGVVGYPGDMKTQDEYGRPDAGSRMYEEFRPIPYNIVDPTGKEKLKMLRYTISTFGGQSGAPVIRKGTNTVIGVHVYGFGYLNAASPIGPEYGNDYDAFVQAITGNFPGSQKMDGIDIIDVQGKSITGSGIPHAATNLAALKGPGTEAVGEDGAESSIWDTLGSIVSTVGSIGGSVLLGPLAAPASALVGTAISHLGNALSESAQDGQPSGKIGADNGAAERAILAESALQAVHALRKAQPHHQVVQNLEDNIKKTYDELLPNLKPIAKKLAPAVVGAAAKIAIHQDYIEKNKIPRTASAPRDLPNTGLRPEAGRESNDFVECMFGPAPVVHGEEAWYDGLASVVTKGLQYAKPVARWGLQQLSNKLAESEAEESAEESDVDAVAAELLAKRAVMAEAALQSVMKLNKSELTRTTFHDPAAGHEESIISFIQKGAQKLYSVVKDNAPAVISKVAPVVLRAVANHISGESARAGNAQPMNGNSESNWMGGNSGMGGNPGIIGSNYGGYGSIGGPPRGPRPSRSQMHINLLGGQEPKNVGPIQA